MRFRRSSSDGQANAGLTDGARIAEQVAGLSQRGINASAFGLGVDFDEDLMGALAGAERCRRTAPIARPSSSRIAANATMPTSPSAAVPT